MKAKIRATGEIVDIISHSIFDYADKCRVPDIDRVSYIDSNGNEVENAKMNIYWDFELIKDNTQTPKEINWDDRKWQIIKILLKRGADIKTVKDCADYIINQLKQQSDEK